MIRTSSTAGRAAGPPADRTACLCPHQPPCPTAEDPDRDAARVTSRHFDQGWSRLCNGVILFEDTGEILPTGRIVEPRRVPPRDLDFTDNPSSATARLMVPAPRGR
jgi:hypothetical protein